MQVIGGSHHHAQLTFRDSTATENNVLFQTVDNAAATDPVRDASLSHHRRRTTTTASGNARAGEVVLRP